MGSQAAAHFAHLRRLAFTKEVQQMAFTFVKYGSAVYCFRTYVMALTAVSFEPKTLGTTVETVQQKTAWDYMHRPACNVWSAQPVPCSAQDRACFQHSTAGETPHCCHSRCRSSTSKATSFCLSTFQFLPKSSKLVSLCCPPELRTSNDTKICKLSFWRLCRL